LLDVAAVDFREIADFDGIGHLLLYFCKVNAV
jgi:hypothetical protein